MSTAFFAALALAALAHVAGKHTSPGPDPAYGRPTPGHAFLYGGRSKPPTTRLELTPGPHLLVDDAFLEQSEGIMREVRQPRRDPAIPNPLVTGSGDGCFQPYMTVLRTPAGRFRMWYGACKPDHDASSSLLGYLESADGMRWKRPVRILEGMGGIQFGVSITDAGPTASEPATRYTHAYYHAGGLKLATSPDGVAWKPLAPDPVIRHSHDINGLGYNPSTGLYTATLSYYMDGPTWRGSRRVTAHATSSDRLHWSQPHLVLAPDDSVEPGETQFYAMDGYLRRGDLLIGMVKVLHDDWHADTPPNPPDAYGVGYTALAWTRDGVNWVRDPSPFLDRAAESSAWDHAHAWIDEQVPVGDRVYLYYAGYKRGHKVNRFQERQIGLLTMPRDRYVARVAGPAGGRMVTPPVKVAGTGLTLNLEAQSGEVRVQVTDADGTPLVGYRFADCRPIVGDGLDLPVRWERSWKSLAGREVRLEFEMRSAKLYALGIRG